MDAKLQHIFDEFSEAMEKADGVLGAWKFGSDVHGTSDTYSDADIIFLFEGDAFKGAEKECSAILAEMCEEMILCFEEAFNSDAIISNSYLLKRRLKG